MDSSSVLLIRGLISLVIGILAFAWPGITIAALVGIFGVFALIDGVMNVMLGMTHSSPQGRSWAHLVQGIFGIAAGVMTFIWPGITALVLVIFIASWAIVTGIFEVIAAIRLRKAIKGEWLLALSGLLSVAFGVLALAFPAAGALTIAFILGAYAAAAGIVLIALGVRLRRVVPA